MEKIAVRPPARAVPAWRAAGERPVGVRRLLLPLAAAILLSACATLGPPKDVVSFRIDVNVPDATVWVDDHLVGSAAVLARDGTFLRVGFHRVEVRHPDYYSYFTEVTPKAGEPLQVHAELHALLR